MTITTRDLHRALGELSDLRFGEIDVDEAMQRIVHTTHAIFDVDGAGGGTRADRLHRPGRADDRLRDVQPAFGP